MLAQTGHFNGRLSVAMMPVDVQTKLSIKNTKYRRSLPAIDVRDRGVLIVAETERCDVPGASLILSCDADNFPIIEYVPG